MSFDYPAFVSSRAKWAPAGHPELNILHAAIGMIGESVEIQFARTRIDMIKELGDFEFYFEFYQQSIPEHPHDYDTFTVIGLPAGLPAALDTLVALSTDILNLAKKGWVYEHPLDTLAFSDSLPQVRAVLDAIYEILGTSYLEVVTENVAKLRLRYPDGYSNEAAAARADGAKDAL